jgi:hypothetical protein
VFRIKQQDLRGGQTAALRIPHTSCIPPEAARAALRTPPIKDQYLLAQDVWRLNTLRWNAVTSMLKTLGAP